jgi:hypothetical protein
VSGLLCVRALIIRAHCCWPSVSTPIVIGLSQTLFTPETTNNKQHYLNTHSLTLNCLNKNSRTTTTTSSS